MQHTCEFIERSLKSRWSDASGKPTASRRDGRPDLVFDLKGEVDVEAAARIDSIRGGIRAITSPIPDAPLSKVVVRMQGAKKGLIVNSRNLCRSKARANVRFDAHNAKRTKLKPVVRPQCGKQKGKRGGGKRRGGKKRRGR